VRVFPSAHARTPMPGLHHAFDEIAGIELGSVQLIRPQPLGNCPALDAGFFRSPCYPYRVTMRNRATRRLSSRFGTSRNAEASEPTTRRRPARAGLSPLSSAIGHLLLGIRTPSDFNPLHWGRHANARGSAKNPPERAALATPVGQSGATLYTAAQPVLVPVASSRLRYIDARGVF
jgi:hypothetical protein